MVGGACRAAAALRRALGERLTRWLAFASALMFVGLAVWVFVQGRRGLLAPAR